MAGDTPLMQMLGTQMRYLTQRQATLSQNIANIDTPGYSAQDLKKPDFAAMASGSGSASGHLAMRTTSPKHFGSGGAAGSNGFASQDFKAFEVSPVKNNVVLDEEMAKISETGANYQVASNLYRKFTGMYRTAMGTK